MPRFGAALTTSAKEGISLYSKVKHFAWVVLGVTLICLLLLAIIGLHSHKLYAVQTGSMSPTIPSRSLVVVESGVYHLGQPVSFLHGTEVVTHRFVGTNPDGTIITKGDGNRTPDVHGVAPDQVIGGVIASYDNVGYWMFYLKNPFGLASIVLLFLLIYQISVYYEDQEESEPSESSPIAA